jgi:hypothetical protein
VLGFARIVFVSKLYCGIKLWFGCNEKKKHPVIIAKVMKLETIYESSHTLLNIYFT